jgi:hypothetical protein
MQSAVASSASGNQVVIAILNAGTAEHLMMDLQVEHVSGQLVRNALQPAANAATATTRRGDHRLTRVQRGTQTLSGDLGIICDGKRSSFSYIQSLASDSFGSVPVWHS